MSVSVACPTCKHVHAADDVRAVGRFGDVAGYQALETLKQQLETCRGLLKQALDLLKQALDENIRLRTALTMIRDHRSPGGSQLISGREAEAIAWAALQPSGGAGLADPSDLSRAPVAGATPPVSNPADIHSDGDIHNDCENGLSGDPARSEQLEAANRLLIDLLSWQPQTQANREVLHPQHRAAIEAAEIFVATPNPAKERT